MGVWRNWISVVDSYSTGSGFESQCTHQVFQGGELMGDVTQVPVGDRIMKLQERVHELEHVVETLQQQVRDLEAAQRAW